MDAKSLEVILTGHEKDLGGFVVHRVLPQIGHKMVGPFVFFDHMGPVKLEAGQAMDVRPHPHINLATVTYLFAGEIRHRDSLGSNQLIEPGAINWMTAGRGIVHSERTPEEKRGQPLEMNGIQLWVALPEEDEECEPSFAHHPRETLPSFEVQGVRVKLLLGRIFDHESPVKVNSNLFYLEVKLGAGQTLTTPCDGREVAAYVVDGEVDVEGQKVVPYAMAIAKSHQHLTIKAVKDSRVMVLGGSSVGRRSIYWNFVSSSKERMDEVKRAWADGPKPGHPRFKPIPGDDEEFIPLPPDALPNPKGTVM